MTKTFSEILGTTPSHYGYADFEEWARKHLEPTLVFTTKDEYIAWLIEWKENRNTLVRQIQELRKTRKMYLRDENGNITGDNPEYNSSYTGDRENLRYTARNHYALRYLAKERARAQYAAKTASNVG